MPQLKEVIKNKIYQKIIKPIIESVSPINEAALGSAIGMFVGLTPTVGIQMWMVLMIWLFCKTFLGVKFDLVIGTALVWISNPLTMFFMYYGFLMTGYAFFSFMGIENVIITYSAFKLEFSTILYAADKSSIQKIIDSAIFLLYDLGIPMILGSFFYAIPFSLLSFWLTKKYLFQYRLSKAAKMGIDYNTWRERYEKK